MILKKKKKDLKKIIEKLYKPYQKFNKLKVGDKVKLDRNCIKWHVDHLWEFFSIPHQGSFPENHFEEMIIWLGSFHNDEPIEGEVIGYGANDESYKDNRRYVEVQLNWRNLKTDGFFSEKDLRRIK